MLHVMLLLRQWAAQTMLLSLVADAFSLGERIRVS
jgi:hypothetical protein